MRTRARERRNEHTFFRFRVGVRRTAAAHRRRKDGRVEGEGERSVSPTRTDRAAERRVRIFRGVAEDGCWAPERHATLVGRVGRTRRPDRLFQRQGVSSSACRLGETRTAVWTHRPQLRRDVHTLRSPVPRTLDRHLAAVRCRSTSRPRSHKSLRPRLLRVVGLWTRVRQA